MNSKYKDPNLSLKYSEFKCYFFLNRIYQTKTGKNTTIENVTIVNINENLFVGSINWIYYLSKKGNEIR